MRIIKNSIGWEDELGFTIAYDEQHSFLNAGRNKEFVKPIWKEDNNPENISGESKDGAGDLITLPDEVKSPSNLKGRIKSIKSKKKEMRKRKKQNVRN